MSWKWIYLFSLTLFTVGWAVFVVLFSTNTIVEKPPDFTEAGAGTFLGILIGWVNSVRQKCMKG